MKAISRRLDRREERFGLAGRGRPPVESWETRHLRLRLETARLLVWIAADFPAAPGRIEGAGYR
jgi:hypothetical protein